tara:strand:+ start:480 stop:599 length:120 start_codon:yes stop_codon:yes gene_type:complete
VVLKEILVAVVFKERAVVVLVKSVVPMDQKQVVMDFQQH